MTFIMMVCVTHSMTRTYHVPLTVFNEQDNLYTGETGKMEQKNDKDHGEYYYDTEDKMFKKKNQPYGPGKTNLFPYDYEFDLKLGKYHPKPPRECRHIEPYDWYTGAFSFFKYMILKYELNWGMQKLKRKFFIQVL